VLAMLQQLPKWTTNEPTLSEMSSCKSGKIDWTLKQTLPSPNKMGVSSVYNHC
jgi:hypothetical protein